MFSKADKVIVDVVTAVGAMKAFHELWIKYLTSTYSYAYLYKVARTE